MAAPSLSTITLVGEESQALGNHLQDGWRSGIVNRQVSELARSLSWPENRKTPLRKKMYGYRPALCRITGGVTLQLSELGLALPFTGKFAPLVYDSDVFQSLNLNLVQALQALKGESSMLQKCLLILCVLCAAILIGCSTTETSNTNTSNENKAPTTTAATPAPPTTTSTTSSSGDKIGVPECDDFIAKYEACVSGKVPEMVRPQFQNALKQWRDGWKKAAENPQTKGTLAAACKQAREQQETALKTYGCTW